MPQLLDEQRILDQLATEEYRIENTKFLHFIQNNKLHGKIGIASSTPDGGGVDEMYKGLVTILNMAPGLTVRWFTMVELLNVLMPKGFPDVTKKIHNRLQGKNGKGSAFSQEMFSTYTLGNHAFADIVGLEGILPELDVVMVEDPQPLMLESIVRQTAPALRDRQTWIWHSHIDTTRPDERWMAALAPYMRSYDLRIFSNEAYIPQHVMDLPNLIIPPGMNSLNSKAQRLPKENARPQLMNFLAEDDVYIGDGPLMTLVARYDPSKGHRNLTEAAQIVQKSIPDIQILFMGAGAPDAPDGRVMFDEISKAAAPYPFIHAYHHRDDAERIQRGTRYAFAGSDVIIVPSDEEGWGLTVGEGLWHGRPVIGYRVGGIQKQITDGVDGYLVSSVPELANRMIHLARNPGIGDDMGRNGRTNARTVLNVAKDFSRLIPQYLKTPQRG